ncbi:signal peptidase I [Nocardioides ultimimeridianus]
MTALTTTRRIAREAALWTGGVLGALCAIALLLGWVLHVTPLVFASGSMSPAYPVGSLGVAHEVPVTDLRIGDVVSVVNDQGVRVTHRIVAIEPHADLAALTLQGDTNDVPDDQSYLVGAVPRVSFGIPYAGYVLNAAASPYGVAVTAAAVIGLLFLGFGSSSGTPGGPARRRTRTLIPVGVVSVLAVGGLAGASGAAPWAFTSAYWTDSASLTTTATVAGPVDTTAPVLTNPLPANGAKASSWASLSTCSATSQLCVSATDTGGSNLSTVTVKLVRTNTNECWNGTSFVSGTGCAAQTMVVNSGSQYRTSGLTAAAMTVGVYQATYVATDGAGNTTSLVTTFATDNTAPTISASGPVAGVRYASSNSGTNSWRQACTAADSVVCVTATDPGGVGVDVSATTFTLVNTTSNTCWNGTAFVAGSSCSVSATNTNATFPNVIYSGPIDPSLLGNGSTTFSYTLTWRVKDLAGNLQTVSIGFTLK